MPDPQTTTTTADERRGGNPTGQAAAFGFLGGLAGFLLGHGSWGVVSGAALGIMLAFLRSTRRQSRALGESLGLLEMRLQSLEIGPVKPTESASQAVQSTTPAERPEPATAASAPPARPAPSPPPPRRVEPTLARRPVPAAGPDRIQQGLNWLKQLIFGGNTIVRVAILILLVGLTIGAKWGIDEGWLTIEARLAFGALTGLALTVVGFRLRDKQRGFGTTLQGGGIAALYLVIFFAYRVYELVPAGMAFALFSLIAAAGGLLAVLQKSQPLVVIGSLAGFLAPILASTGEGNHVFLFSYYLLLNLAIASVVWFQSWRPLQVLAFVCTYGVATAWGVLRYEPAQFASTEPFLLAFMLLFSLQAVVFSRRGDPLLRDRVDGTLVFGTPLVTLIAQARLVSDMEFGMAYSAAGFGLYYALLATWLRHTAPTRMRRMTEAFVALAVGFGTMAIPFAFEAAFPTAIAWSLEGAGLYWVGARQDRKLARLSGILLQGLAGIAFSVAVADRSWHTVSQELVTIANGRFLSCLAIAISGAFIAREAYAHRDGPVRAEWYPTQLLAVWGLGWWSMGGAVEIDQFVASRYDGTALVAFIAFTTLLLEFGGRALRWLPGRLLGLLGVAAAFLLIPLILDIQPHLFAQGGIVVWPVCIAAFHVALGRVERDAPSWLPNVYAPVLWLTALVTAIGLAGFVDHGIELSGDWPAAAFGLGLAGVVLLTRVAIDRDWGAFGRHESVQLWKGVGPVTGLALLWTVYANFAARGDVAPLAYLPILNPIDVVMAVVLVTSIHWWLGVRADQPQLGDDLWPKLPAPVFGGLAFVWLNAILVRSVHQWTHVPFYIDSLWDSGPLQVSFSIAWTLVALGGMLLSTHRSWRTPWLTFAALLAVVVAKLFLVDLSQLSTGPKVVTFLVVGVLLLVVGYWSPVPPSSGSGSADEDDAHVAESGGSPS